ncbi:hypothetical protein [Pseudoxanthomonas sp. UTMC 1351]|uniref:hypothetical protein n=1 Tax=Pseudoxanthomonas sp. UTMC 1351 TaxID=2695853 RepID=UPI0034CEC473
MKIDKEPQSRERDPLEKTRAPNTPRAPGEQPGKRNNDERNDPESEPGAKTGNQEDDE